MAHETIIGKDLLRSLMFSLYPEPETIYREYLQNACDSINEAVKEGILNDVDDGRVIVTIEDYNSKVSITDNGVGIPFADAERVLKDIASSPKKGKDYTAGFYGIGRLEGAGYCKELIFETSYYGEDKCSVMVFDVEKLRSILEDDENKSTATQVIDSITTFSTKKEKKEEHYFNVILKDILSDYSSLLDETQINKYLCQVAPVTYSPEFKKMLIKPSLQNFDPSFKEYYENLNTIKISLNKIADIKKKYGLTISGTGDEIRSLQFFLLNDSKLGKLAWGWYAITPFTTQIPDKDSQTNEDVLTRGMRLRIHNIQIGNQNFFDGTNYFKQARSNKYFNGEIHVLHPNIKPTTDRSNLAPSPETKALNREIVKFFNDEMQKVYQEANKIKKEIERAIKTDQQIIEHEEKGTSSNSRDVKNLKEDQKKQQESIDKHFEKGTQNSGMGAMLQIYKDQLDSFKNSSTKEKKDVKVSVPSLEPKNFDLNSELKELTKKYGKDKIDMVRLIFKIIDNNWKNREIQVRAFKSLVVKGLKK